MNPRRLPCVRALLLAILPALQASAQQDPFEPGAAPSTWIRLQANLDHWRAAHGPSWKAVYDEETGYARFLYGGSAAPAFQPRSDSDWFAAARAALRSTRAMHGVDVETLVDERVAFLPLALGGSSDKITVGFRQAVDGVPVVRASANVLFDLRGRLLSVDVTALPELAGWGTLPALQAPAAAERALGFFAKDAALPPTEVSAPELVIVQRSVPEGRRPLLAWRVAVGHYPDDSAPAGYVYYVDAQSGALAAREDAVHHDVSGKVQSMASPGLYPDKASNPPVPVDMRHMSVTSPQGNAKTDASGNFTIVGATAPVSVTVKYQGSFATVNNNAGAAYSLTVPLSTASGNTILMNSPAQGLVTSQANAYHWINVLRDWVRAVNPNDPTADFLATANTNLSQTCNAYYNGFSVNFYQPGGNCPSTAYSTIVVHEMGHWLNDRYDSGNGPDGFGEGNADVFAMYVADDPVVGYDFCGNGCIIRTGLNNTQFCGDNSPGCHGGEVHKEGEVLMGALWKVRARLKTSLGASAGAGLADALFLGWMNAYNDGQIKTIIETHWLVLDDDDGNIDNGTPHYMEIDGGFKDQGFPGYALKFVTFANVTVLPDTQNEAGPYQVQADISTTFAPPVVAPTLHYSVNGAPFAGVAMTSVSGNTYSAGIPGQTAPAIVEYYLVAEDGNGQSGSFPVDAPTFTLKFAVGILTVRFSDTFESGTNGWTHGLLANQDDWQLSSQVGANGAFGKAGDPSSAFSGTNIWGNDLGPSGWNGSYMSNTHNWLRSPPIDLSQATGSRLRFKRWLTVERSIKDKARILVNGQEAWINPATTDLLDTSWNEVDLDISAFADGQPAVQIELRLQSDSSGVFGGWNIDDFQVVTLEPICPKPTTYCTAKLTSALTLPAIGSTGSATLAANNFAVTLSQAVPDKNAVVFWGGGAASQPFNGGTLCVAPPLTRGPVTMTDGTGAASTPIVVEPAMVGTTLFYQWWFRDPADFYKVGLSDALTVTFCN
jgi:hypothetical protein